MLLSPYLMGPAQTLGPMAGPQMPQAAPQRAPGAFPAAPQAPGRFAGVGQRLRGMLAPEIALPAAAAMMQGRNLGESVGGAFGAMGQGLALERQRQDEVQQKNLTRTWLLGQGLNEMEADAAMSNPAVLNHYLKLKTGGSDGPASVQEWNHFNSLSPEDQARYLRMKRANPYLDIGTGFVQPDPVNPGGISGGPITKENYQEKFDQQSGTEDAKAAAERRANLPKVEQQATTMLSTLDTLENHPGFKKTVGWQGNIPEWMIPAGSESAGFLSVLNQVQGQAFLQAFESLKGGGQITEVEGRKATEAITRLNRKLSEAEFKQAIGELREVINRGLDRARRGVTVNEQGVEVQSAPAAGGQRLRYNPATGDFE